MIRGDDRLLALILGVPAEAASEEMDQLRATRRALVEQDKTWVWAGFDLAAPDSEIVVEPKVGEPRLSESLDGCHWEDDWR